MAVFNGMSDFKNMATPLNNVNTPKKVTPPVTKEVQKQREKGSSNLEMTIF